MSVLFCNGQLNHLFLVWIVWNSCIFGGNGRHRRKHWRILWHRDNVLWVTIEVWAWALLNEETPLKTPNLVSSRSSWTTSSRKTRQTLETKQKTRFNVPLFMLPKPVGLLLNECLLNPQGCCLMNACYWTFQTLRPKKGPRGPHPPGRPGRPGKPWNKDQSWLKGSLIHAPKTLFGVTKTFSPCKQGFCLTNASHWAFQKLRSNQCIVFHSCWIQLTPPIAVTFRTTIWCL